MNVHQIFYMHLKNVQTIQNLYKFQIKVGLKLEMHVFCVFTQCKNYTKCIQS